MPDDLNNAIYQKLPVFGQNLLCTVAGYWRYRSRFSPRFYEALAELEKSAVWPLERLHEIQRIRLDRLVTRAREHSPFYRNLPPPSDHRNSEEAIHRTLLALPILEKSDYREQPETDEDVRLAGARIPQQHQRLTAPEPLERGQGGKGRGWHGRRGGEVEVVEVLEAGNLASAMRRSRRRASRSVTSAPSSSARKARWLR